MSLDIGADLFVPREAELANELVKIVTSGSNTSIRRLECLRVADELIFEGDIIVRSVPLWSQAMEFATKTFGHGVKDRNYLWRGGVVPFACNRQVEHLVIPAIEHWMDCTPIRFTQVTDESDFVTFQPGDASRTEVGRVGGKQVVRLSPSTEVGTAIHEIGHVLGLWHEHSRSDRLEHITVHLDNVHPMYRSQFEQPVNAVDLGAYDYRSIMHYPPDAFSTNGKPTITTRNGQSIGQRNGLSGGDIAATRSLYPDLHWP